MLIIFDLDDTLIDTSAYLTPSKLQKILAGMINEGYFLGGSTQALEDLLYFNKTESSSGVALKRFSEQYGIDSKRCAVALKELYDTLPDPGSVRPVSGAMEVLQELSKEGALAVVSIGNEEQQLFKLEKAGIPLSLFYKIFVLEEKNKKKYYLLLIEEMKIDPKQVIVCGDRISIDLIPAKEIGCCTVHMERGRGLNEPSSAKEQVDFSIKELSELVEICAKIRNR